MSSRGRRVRTGMHRLGLVLAGAWLLFFAFVFWANPPGTLGGMEWSARLPARYRSAWCPCRYPGSCGDPPPVVVPVPMLERASPEGQRG
jgi:hypothetical protein